MIATGTRHSLAQVCFFFFFYFFFGAMSTSSSMAFVIHRTLPPTPPPRTHLTRLQSIMPPTAAAAATALTGSALTGMWMERRKPNSGILTSLAVSSLVFSRMAPATHFLYDRCWDTFLPASLALLLLGMPQTKTNENSDKDAIPQDSIRTVVRRLALPFGLASIGSLLGCTVSFLLCRSFRSSVLWLSTQDAAWAGACLSASFVGGSVNFLATAAWIASQTTNHGRTTLVGAMTAADLMVMAVYFALMAAATQSVSLKRWFDRKNARGTTLTTTSAATSTAGNIPIPSSSSSPSPSFHIPTALWVATVAFGLVHLGQLLEHKCARYIPGTACAFLAAVTPWVSRYMPQRASTTAPPLSQLCFFLLFAAVGVTADLGAALQSGPACLVFAAVALLMHGLVLLCGGRYFLSSGRPHSFVDCLIASNAAIGGPATAATFCGTLNNNTQALTIAATIWGVFGYAIGTTVGVGMYRFLSAFV